MKLFLLFMAVLSLLAQARAVPLVWGITICRASGAGRRRPPPEPGLGMLREL